MVNQKMNLTVREAVSWDVNGAVRDAVYGAVDDAVRDAVREVVSWAVHGAEVRAEIEDPPHPALQDFLRFADVRVS